jgi:hypothetical protein
MDFTAGYSHLVRISLTNQGTGVKKLLNMYITFERLAANSYCVQGECAKRYYFTAALNT